MRGGRVPRWIKSVADALQLMPVLHNTGTGHIKSGGVLFGRRNLKEKFARHVLRSMSSDRTYRLLIGHANAEADGNWLMERLKGERCRGEAAAARERALGVHGGPGMLCVGVQARTG